MMRFKSSLLLIATALLFAGSVVTPVTDSASYSVAYEKTKPAAVDLITADELKAKMEKNEPVTIIDVRATTSFADSENTIKNSIHVKVRRLQYRLTQVPLKNVPRDSEVVTYCACPNDEASIHAAEILKSAGFKRVRVLKGGWQAWVNAGGKVQSKPRGM
jgi:rhodanese-related sulfurtransferase